MNNIDSIEFRNACGSFATGVTVISSKIKDGIHGMTVNGFMSVSLNPALIVVSIGKNQKMHDVISKSGSYSVSVLGASQTELSNHFAGKFNKDLNVEFENEQNTPYLSKNIAYFSAKVKSAYSEGDHTLFIGEVEQFGVSNHEGPLLFSKGQYKNLKQ